MSTQLHEYRKLVRSHPEPCSTCKAGTNEPCRQWNGSAQTNITPVHEARSMAFYLASQDQKENADG